MGQVAFDTLQASEELQTAGLTSEQAKAISLVVRKSHEVADVATKRDLEDVRKEIEARFDKVDARFEKTDAQIADVRKDIAQIDKRLDFSEKRFDRLEIKFDRLQWFLLAGILSLLFQDVLPKLWGG
ncbi:hypothetical protein [Candidatus Sodalis sp. SoCistrobi]|uniref:hypothetical protein n=1 Tax=Candidatus Sodalis sp. SoCistrobi TaxID=1922216 RepID=UPI00093920E2|nr:hypothetical protein [Candidatus Sodalis sp. SoCistrobi]